MPYATQADLVERFGETELIQISNRSLGATTIDAVVVASKLADADAEIDGYLQGRYQLPLVPVPAVLLRLACDISRYHLYDDRVTEAVMQRYKDAIAYLVRVSKGEVQLGLGAGEAPPASSGGPEFATPGREFTRDSLRDFTG